MNLPTQKFLFPFLLALNALLTPALALACGAEGGDNREVVDACEEAGASVHPPVEPATATAHPVDLITGNKTLRQLDVRWPGGLSLVRHYNSRNKNPGALGPGWRHSFDTRLYFHQRNDQATVQIVQGDGRRIVFRSQAKAESSPVVLQASPSLYGTVRHQTDVSADRRWVWRWIDGSALFFSARGLLTSIERANGQRLQLQYGGKPARLLTVTNRYRQSLHFEYAVKGGLLHRVRLPDQQVVRYAYDATGVLTGVTRGEQRLWTFEHADHLLGAVTKVRNALNKITNEVRYGAQGRAIYSALGNAVDAIELSYHLPAASFGIGKTQIRAIANQKQVSSWQWRYDPVTQQRLLLSATGPGCTVCPQTGITNRYDSQRRLVEHRDGRGNGFTYAYDRLSRLVRVKRHSAQDRVGIQDTRMEYESDALDAPIKQISRASVASGKTHQLKFERDSLGRIIQVSESGFEPDLATLSRSTGRLTKWRIGRWKPLKRRWTIEYVPFGAAAGLPWQIDGPLPGPKDAIRFVYDQAGRPVTRFGPHRRQVNWQYDVKGLLAQTVNDGVVVESRAYDRFNRLVQRHSRGVKHHFAFDAAGHRIQIGASNRPTINLVRDGNGRLTALRDKQTRELTLASVVAGLKRLTPGSAAVWARLEAVKHAPGIYERRKPNTTEQELRLIDDFGRTVARLDSETGLERRVYDDADRLLARIDAAGKLSRFFYHENGRLQKIVGPAGDLLHRQWDTGGLKSESQRYQHIAYQYDELGRPKNRSIRYNDPVTGQGFTHPIQQSWTFDDKGRLIQRPVGAGYALQYEWSAHNELASVNLLGPGNYTKTLANEIQWLPFAGGQRGLVSARLGNGFQLDRQFDESMRPIRIQYRGTDSSNDPALTVEYSYDELGKVASKSINNEVIRYQHDARGRLTAASKDKTITTYDHSPEPPSRTIRQPLASSLLKTAASPINPQAKKPIPWYTSPTGSQVSLSLTGRPAWALTKNRAVWRYVYNASGERIGRLNLTDPKQSRWYVYENRRLLMETNDSGKPTRLFVRLDDRPLAVIDLSNREPNVQWVHTDAMGLPVASSNESAKLLWQGALDPWGSNPAGENTPPIPLRLPGQIYDPETGLHDNYLRTYDPERRAYLGPDPLGLRSTGNRYAYANHSPLDTSDPLGLYEIDMHYYATLVIALSAGMTYQEAMLIANANQYVDNGIDTQPIILDENGEMDVLRTGLFRQQVLRDWHFVLDEDNPDNLTVGNPTSERLTVLENWVDSAPDRLTQMFNLGVFSHPYLDTAAHRDENNVPYPATRFRFAFGHAHDMHHPDYTFNHCQEFPVVVVDGNNPEQPPVHNVSWNNNESRTITIQEGLYEIYRRYAVSEAAVSWEDLEVMLREFNAIHESEDPHNNNHEETLGQKLRLLERFLRKHQIRTDGSESQRISFVWRGQDPNSAYDESRAELQWASYFENPSDGLDGDPPGN